MAFNIDNNGNITMISGDSGTITIDGLNTDRNYTLYLGIQDINRKSIGAEIKVNSHKMSSVVFELTGDYTDLMTIPKNQDYALYYYGIKQCSEDGLEDTLLIGNTEIGDKNTILVYPKKVEGL